MSSESDSIWLVDDSRDDVELTRVAFAQAGVVERIIEVGDGLSFLELYDQLLIGRVSRPTLVVLDLNLPMLSGIDLLEKMHERPASPPLRALILTSSDDPAERVRSFELGAEEYLQKPVSFADYINVAKYIRQRFLR